MNLKSFRMIYLLFTLLLLTRTPLSAAPVSEPIARQVALQKLAEFYYAANFSLENSAEIPGPENQILGYVFRLKPTGYIIISADTRLRPVIAHSATSQFGEFDVEKNILLRLLMADLENRLRGDADQAPQVIAARRQLWEQYRQPELKKTASPTFQQWPPEGTTNTGGWLQTQWDQEDPFNRYCPLDAFAYDRNQQEQRSVAGCPAVALSQIIYFYQTLNGARFDDRDDYTDAFYSSEGIEYHLDDDFERYKFLSFPQLNAILEEIDLRWQNRRQLTTLHKAALIFACGIAAKQVYSAQISGTYSVQQAYDAYLRFNFDEARLFKTNTPASVLYPALAQNMKDGRPAHLAVITSQRTAGHNLVVDGYNTNEEYHLNFGFQGVYDGWYTLPDASIPGYAFTVIEGVIVDIYDPAKATVKTAVVPRILNFSLTNYPNPFNPVTNIQYTLTSPGQVQLQVFDLLGREVRRLVDTRQAAGIYQVGFNAANLAGGIYLCRLSFGSISKTHRMLLLK
jgi:hypothetical protein